MKNINAIVLALIGIVVTNPTQPTDFHPLLETNNNVVSGITHDMGNQNMFDENGVFDGEGEKERTFKKVYFKFIRRKSYD